MTNRGSEPVITIRPTPGGVRVTLGGEVVADSRRALTLVEAGHAAVQYIPREDVAMNLLMRSERVTRCPRKGEASYFTIVAGGQEARDAAWSYEAPLPAVAEIAYCLAFYPSRVDLALLDPPSTAP